MSAIEHEFFVSRDGVLSATREGDIPPYPRSRRELYGFAAGKTADSFIELAGKDRRVEELLWEECESAMDDADPVPDGSGWKEWLRRADAGVLKCVRGAIDRWLDDMGEADHTLALADRFSGQEQALNFFREQRATATLLNIVLVGTDSPSG